MKIEKQLCIFLENIPERIADICLSLANDGVNILALSVLDTVDYGVARLLVDNPKKAADILSESHYAFTEVQVVSVELSNNPGALAETVRKLVRAKIKIEYAYQTAFADAPKAQVILRVHPIKKAMEVLQS